MGPISCSETSVRNYHYSLRNDQEKRRSHLLRGGSLKFLRILKSQVRGPVKFVVPNTLHIPCESNQQMH